VDFIESRTSAFDTTAFTGGLFICFRRQPESCGGQGLLDFPLIDSIPHVSGDISGELAIADNSQPFLVLPVDRKQRVPCGHHLSDDINAGQKRYAACTSKLLA